jgi:hypothetical protein
MILKLPIRSPFHPDQLRCQHGKPRIAKRDHGFGVGHWIGHLSSGLGMR